MFTVTEGFMGLGIEIISGQDQPDQNQQQTEQQHKYKRFQPAYILRIDKLCLHIPKADEPVPAYMQRKPTPSIYQAFPFTLDKYLPSFLHVNSTYSSNNWTNLAK
jgi:hypothetical protein